MTGILNHNEWKKVLLGIYLDYASSVALKLTVLCLDSNS